MLSNRRRWVLVVVAIALTTGQVTGLGGAKPIRSADGQSCATPAVQALTASQLTALNAPRRLFVSLGGSKVLMDFVPSSLSSPSAPPAMYFESEPLGALRPCAYVVTDAHGLRFLVPTVHFGPLEADVAGGWFSLPAGDTIRAMSVRYARHTLTTLKTEDGRSCADPWVAVATTPDFGRPVYGNEAQTGLHGQRIQRPGVNTLVLRWNLRRNYAMCRVVIAQAGNPVVRSTSRTGSVRLDLNAGPLLYAFAESRNR